MMDENSVETIELELAILLRRGHKKIGNLDRSAYLLLHRLASYGSAGVKTLADEFGLDISTVSRQAAVLEQKGYVHRIPDPLDGRAYSLEITDSGSKELNQNKQTRLNKITELLQSWSEEEQKIFGELLRKFNRALG